MKSVFVCVWMCLMCAIADQPAAIFALYVVTVSNILCLVSY